MTIDAWLAFALASTVVLMIPGPTILLVCSYALSAGRRAGLWMVGGVALGDLVAMTASVLGLGALLLSSAELFTALRLIGAAYLLYLGWKLWTAPVGPVSEADAPQASGPKMAAHAFAVTATNPKSIVFFVAFVPQFIDPAAPLAALYEHGIRSASVELGGELALGDPPPGQAGWPVAMECGGGRPGGWLELSNVGVATSGSGEQFVEHEGEHFSHVIDPRSGLGVQHEVCATVVASDAATADALASAVLVAGPRKARTIVRRVQGATLRLHPPDARALFDGETLTGWTESGGRYDGDADWTVEDGAIVGRVGEGGRGGLLYTEDLFTSFELELDVRVDYPFDSGIFLRMAPEGKGAQITIDHREGGEIAAVYSDGFLKHDRETRLKEGEWNHFEVRCTGFDMRIEVWLNGDKVTDYSIEPDSPGYAPTGRIGLQVHGDRDDPRENAVRFRNVRVRELGIFGEELWQEPSQERLALTGAATEAGWRSLLARDSLEGWGVVGPEEGYRVENAELFVPKAGGSGHVWTSEDFEDFRLRLDFMTSEVANSGVFLRADRGGGNPAYSGCEVQILDDFNWEKAYESTLLPTQFTGSLYGAVPPGRRDALREPGNWNTYEILYRGPRLAVALNGIPLYDVRTHELEADPPFAERVPRGAIGLQRYDCPQATGDWTVRFRNVFVQALK